MVGLIFAALTALSVSIKELFIKRGLKIMDEYFLAFFLRIFIVFILFPFLIFIGLPEIKNGFWLVLLFSTISLTVTTLLYLKAIKNSDLSLTIPMMAFTPFFMLLTSPLIIGEFPNIFGLIGVLLIVFGSYLLNIKERKKGYLEPFKCLLRKEGPRLMLLVAFIWSIGSNFDKIGVQSSSSLFWVVVVNFTTALVLYPVMLYKSSIKLRTFKSNFKSISIVGVFNAIEHVFHTIAIKLTLVIYVVAIKRTSILLTVLLSYFIFHEKNIISRLSGAAIMVLGIIFIAFS